MTRQDIIRKIKTDDDSVKSFLLMLYGQQTADERRGRYTYSENRRGFNRADAPVLTSIADQLIKKRWLTWKQIEAARSRLIKYANQLSRLTQEGDEVWV